MSYLYQDSVDFLINMAEVNKKERGNIYNVLQYETYSPVLSNKTEHWNLQHYTKLHNEVCKLLHNKIY